MWATSPKLGLALLSMAILSAILSSPRWAIPVFAWIEPVCLLWFFRLTRLKRKILWAMAGLLAMSVLSNYRVSPFPLPVLAVMAIYQALEQLLVYLADRWVMRRTTRFAGTLFFPAAYVTLEYFNATFTGGLWWSVVNTQYPFTWLTQLVSVTGVWGIIFLVYWFGSVTVWALAQWLDGNQRPAGKKLRTGLLIYGATLVTVLLFGLARYSMSSYNMSPYTMSPETKLKTVRTAGLSVPLPDLLQAIYKDYSGRDIIVDPRSAITDPVLQKIALAETAFIENMDSVKFKNSLAAMGKVNDSLFVLSQRAADSGAKIICWSEGNAIAFKPGEAGLIARGRRFAAKNQLYLLMAIEVVHAGKITPGKKFMENEAVMLGPQGQVLTVFHKNNPVPMVEACEPGDGHIPSIATGYGNLGLSICYDADFPFQMRQVGRNKTDLLLLPSGDWYSISPYHTYMAVYRAVENGCSMMRQASSGLSLATDYRGKAIGSLDYFKDGTKLWLADIPVGHVETVYSKIGDVFAWCCMGFTVITCCCLMAFSWKSQKLVVPN
jgi:apolipoprotein N-acyltransferase